MSGSWRNGEQQMSRALTLTLLLAMSACCALSAAAEPAMHDHQPAGARDQQAQTVYAAPELDPGMIAGGLALVIGVVLIVRGRRARIRRSSEPPR
jgi:hypothetical protein